MLRWPSGGVPGGQCCLLGGWQGLGACWHPDVAGREWGLVSEKGKGNSKLLMAAMGNILAVGAVFYSILTFPVFLLPTHKVFHPDSWDCEDQDWGEDGAGSSQERKNVSEKKEKEGHTCPQPAEPEEPAAERSPARAPPGQVCLRKDLNSDCLVIGEGHLRGSPHLTRLSSALDAPDSEESALRTKEVRRPESLQEAFGQLGRAPAPISASCSVWCGVSCSLQLVASVLDGPVCRWISF